MTLETEIWEALESTASNRNPKASGFIHEGRETANRRDISLWRKSLLSFLGEVDGDLSIEEVREALDSWTPNAMENA